MASRLTRSKGSNSEELIQRINDLESKLAAEITRRETWRLAAIQARDELAGLLVEKGASEASEMIVDEEEHESPVEAVLRDLQREVKCCFCK